MVSNSVVLALSLAAAACALVALGFLVSIVLSTVRATRVAPRLQLIERLRGQWRSSLLKEQAIASRLIDIITSPVVRERLRLTLTINGSSALDTGDFAEDRTKICVTVEAEFGFVNLGSNSIVISLRDASPIGSTQSGRGKRITNLSVDGTPCEAVGTVDSEQSYDFEIAPGSNRQVHLTSLHCATLPYVAVFPQNVPVRGDTVIRVVSHVRDSTGLLVTGQRGSSCNRYDDDWWEDEDELNYCIPVTEPLLPGDTIFLTVGV